MGDSLTYYTFLTFINFMANKIPYTLDNEGNTNYFTRIHYEEFINYPPRTNFIYFDKACKDVNEEPFLLFMDNNAYLDISPTTLEWISNHSNAIMFINRGYHYQRTSPDYMKGFESVMKEYLQRLHHEPPSSPSPRSSKNGYLIFRSIHMAHPSCSKYKDSYPFTDLNYSSYQTPTIMKQYHSSYNWYEIIQQDKELVQPILHKLIHQNIFDAQKKLFYLDILSSSKLMISRHTSDCLHYCVPGPMDSWIDFLQNVISLLNESDDNEE